MRRGYRNLKNLYFFLMENPDVKQMYWALKYGARGMTSEYLARIRKNNLAWAEKIRQQLKGMNIELDVGREG